MTPCMTRRDGLRPQECQGAAGLARLFVLAALVMLVPEDDDDDDGLFVSVTQKVELACPSIHVPEARVQVALIEICIMQVFL